ncbi:MAG TPA: DUF4252 domain-containing protein [Bacteroidales bacterium]
MKTIFLYAFLLILSIPCKSQNKAIDDIFNKFDGKDGVTTVNISKDLMKLATQMDSSDVKAKDLFGQIGGVKILTFEKAKPEDKVAFDSMVKSLNVSDYKELMMVKEKDNNVRMLLKENQGKITEFLLLVTGGNDPVLISIVGSIDPKELGKLSGCMKMNGFEYLAKLNKK